MYSRASMSSMHTSIKASRCMRTHTHALVKAAPARNVHAAHNYPASEHEIWLVTTGV